MKNFICFFITTSILLLITSNLTLADSKENIEEAEAQDTDNVEEDEECRKFAVSGCRMILGGAQLAFSSSEKKTNSDTLEQSVIGIDVGITTGIFYWDGFVLMSYLGVGYEKEEIEKSKTIVKSLAGFLKPTYFHELSEENSLFLYIGPKIGYLMGNVEYENNNIKTRGFAFGGDLGLAFAIRNGVLIRLGIDLNRRYIDSVANSSDNADHKSTYFALEIDVGVYF